MSCAAHDGCQVRFLAGLGGLVEAGNRARDEDCLGLMQLPVKRCQSVIATARANPVIANALRAIIRERRLLLC